jgi:hypothetical protein
MNTGRFCSSYRKSVGSLSVLDVPKMSGVEPTFREGVVTMSEYLRIGSLFSGY